MSAPDSVTASYPVEAGAGTAAGREPGMNFPEKVPGFEDTPGNTLRYAAVSGSILEQEPGVLMELISGAVERKVTEVIRKLPEERRTQEPAGNLNMPGQEVPVSDKQVRMYMRQMRKLAEEERFRLGLLH